MVRLEDAIIARLEVGGERFEVLVDPDLALAVREGKEVDPDDLLVIDEVFRDARKGEKASEEAMKRIFGTSDPVRVAFEIIRRGEIRLTTEQRRRLIEDKKREIAAIISRRSINPQTGTPHPPDRILSVMEDVGVSIDPLKPASEQVEKVIKAIRHVLPIKIEERYIAAKIPPQHAPRVYGHLREYGDILKEEWASDGSLIVLIKIPAGVQEEFFVKLNNLTRGEVETRVLEEDRVGRILRK